MKVRVSHWGLALLVIVLCAGCTVARPTATPSPVPTPTQPPGLSVDCWAEPPEPTIGSIVTVHMNLLNYGTPINGVVTYTRWKQHDDIQLCVTQVQYELGSCYIDVIDYEPGVYVPVTVSVEYVGWTFLGYTGFTPR